MFSNIADSSNDRGERDLSPGDQAWYVRPGHAERVLVTARRRTRVVIARLNDAAEELSVRRTRVLLVPAD